MVTSLVDVLNPLVPTAVHLLMTSVQSNQLEGRGILAYLVRVLPLLNKEARDLWRKEYDALVLLTLCDYLFDSGHRTRYLDGVLPDFGNDLQNWYDPLDAELMPDQTGQQIIALESIHKNRGLVARRIVTEEAVEFDSESIAPVRFMLSIVREHAAFKLHRTYAQHFGTCQRVGCSRPAFLAPPEVPEEDDDESSEAQYWQCCRDGRAPPPTSSLPSDMSFCSNGCFKAANSEFQQLVRFDIVTPPCETRRGGGATPSRLYRAAVKRNLGIARELRAKPQAQTNHYPSSFANRERLLREQTTMLSVDLGLLYAASLVNELPSKLRPNRPLPRTENWREQGVCFLNAACRVRAIYLKYGRGELARDGSELWLRRLRDKLLEVF